MLAASQNPLFTDVLHLYSQNISRWWSSGSDSLPLPAASPRIHFFGHILSFLWSQSQKLLCSASSARSVRAFFRLELVTPKDFKKHWVDAPVKSPHPTSTRNINALHPICEHAADRSAYFPFSSRRKPPFPFSHDTVSSAKMANLAKVDYSMMSGRNKVVVIS